MVLWAYNSLVSVVRCALLCRSSLSESQTSCNIPNAADGHQCSLSVRTRSQVFWFAIYILLLEQGKFMPSSVQLAIGLMQIILTEDYIKIFHRILPLVYDTET
jgi:hypothetical protein